MTITTFPEDSPIQRILPLVGQTPLLEIDLRFRGQPMRLFAKYEALNLTGSIKDRMAAHIIGRAYQTGNIQPGDEIAEASSGNTAISLAAVGRALGHPVKIFMPDWMSQERVTLLESFGASLVSVSHEQGGFVGSINMAREYAASRSGVFEPRQFSNEWNVEAHALGTGPEILQQLAVRGLEPSAFVAGVGTGGTVMGVGAAFKDMHECAGVHPLEPSESPILSTGHKGDGHRIQGISDEFIPSIVNLEDLDEIVAVNDGDGILMAQRLCRELGLAVGISSGANVAGAVKLLDTLGPEAVVITILPDSNKKYLSTDLCREEPVQDGYLATEVEFESFSAISGCECR